jgi:hypothetical protein
MIELIAWILQATFSFFLPGQASVLQFCLGGHTQVLGSTEGFLGRPRPHSGEKPDSKIIAVAVALVEDSVVGFGSQGFGVAESFSLCAFASIV